MTKEIPSDDCAGLLDGERPCDRAENPCSTECSLAALTMRVLGVSDVSPVTFVRHGDFVGIAETSGSGVSVRYIGRVEKDGTTIGLNGCDDGVAGLVTRVADSTPSKKYEPDVLLRADSTDVPHGESPNSTGRSQRLFGGSPRTY